MFANRYTAVIDACSLVGVLNRNFLLSLAEAEFFRLRWSQDILDETLRALERLFAKRGFPSPQNRAEQSIKAMTQAFPEALVEEYSGLMAAGKELPDQKDAHVLAVAIKTQAQTIVTENLKDFPQSVLDPLQIEARTADDFIADTIALDEGRAIPVVRNLRTRLKKPTMNRDQFLKNCEKYDLLATADQLKPYIDLI